MKIIDAHIHFYDIPAFHLLAEQAGHQNTAQYLKKEFDRLGIQGAVVMGNGQLDLCHHTYPSFMRYCINLDHQCFEPGEVSNCIDLVEQHLRRKECVGIKFYPGYHAFYVYDDVCRPYLELAATYQKPVAIHTGETAGRHNLLKYCHPLTLDKAAGEHPNVEFVMCHWGNPWVVDAAAVINKHPNISTDLSGLLEGYTDMEQYKREQAGYIAHLSTWLHYMQCWDRVMYGTDFPLANMEQYIDLIAHLIPSQYHEAVFADNARRIYQLDF
ncbi:MAG: amidohydrolase family protein [Oscillospiraceae bacterium]|jgi:predicted TIM-barrel fold metal-dependent hydrolase